MGHTKLMLYSLFIIFCHISDQTQTLSRINHATCDVYSPKAVETLIHGQCYRYCNFLYCVYNIFSFRFIEALDSKGVINTLKNYYVSHGMR